MVKVKKFSAEDGYNKPFAVRLRKLLKDNKVSQEELADFVGVKRQSISAWKDGKTVPDINSLIKISQRFNVSTDYLLGLSDDPQRHPSAVDKLGLTPAARDIIEKDTNTPNLGELISGVIEDDKFYYFQLLLSLAIAEKARSLNYDEDIFNEYRRQAEHKGGVLLSSEQAIAYYVDKAKTYLSACVDNYMEQALMKQQILFETQIIDDDD